MLALSYRDCRLPALATILLLAKVKAQGQCFLPDGTVAYGDVPCSSSSPAQCCSSTGGICLSNGLCFNPSVNLMSRSSCTDQTWAASVCTTICKTINPSAFETVLSCGAGLFCCPPAADSAPDLCCFNSGGTFSLPAGNLIDAAVDNAGLSTITAISTIIEISSQATVTPQVGATSLANVQTATQSITTIQTATRTLTTSQSGVATANAAGEAITQASTANITVTSSVCMQQSAMVGAGVGVPMAGALMIVSFLLYKARKKHQRDSIALGAHNLMTARSSLYTVPSKTLTAQTVVIPPVPPRPISRLLPFTDIQGRDTSAFGRRIS